MKARYRDWLLCGLAWLAPADAILYRNLGYTLVKNFASISHLGGTA